MMNKNFYFSSIQSFSNFSWNEEIKFKPKKENIDKRKIKKRKIIFILKIVCYLKKENSPIMEEFWGKKQ